MADIKYDIRDLLSKAFGPTKVIAAPSALVSIQAIEEASQISRLSYLGTPVLHPIIFGGQAYNVYTDNGEISQVTLAPFELPVTTLSTFSRQKNISETDMTAGNGTITEMYSFRPWNIDIRGLCLYDPVKINAITAYEQHMRLLEFEKVADSIPVISKLFNDKGIDAINIRRIVFDQIEGRPGVIPFWISAQSARPQELIL
jgi:hypothetical protein